MLVLQKMVKKISYYEVSHLHKHLVHQLVFWQRAVQIFFQIHRQEFKHQVKFSIFK